MENLKDSAALRIKIEESIQMSREQFDRLDVSERRRIYIPVKTFIEKYNTHTFSAASILIGMKRLKNYLICMLDEKTSWETKAAAFAETYVYMSSVLPKQIVKTHTVNINPAAYMDYDTVDEFEKLSMEIFFLDTNGPATLIEPWCTTMYEQLVSDFCAVRKELNLYLSNIFNSENVGHVETIVERSDSELWFTIEERERMKMDQAMAERAASDQLEKQQRAAFMKESIMHHCKQADLFVKDHLDKLANCGKIGEAITGTHQHFVEIHKAVNEGNFAAAIKALATVNKRIEHVSNQLITLGYLTVGDTDLDVSDSPEIANSRLEYIDAGAEFILSLYFAKEAMFSVEINPTLLVKKMHNLFMTAPTGEEYLAKPISFLSKTTRNNDPSEEHIKTCIDAAHTFIIGCLDDVSGTYSKTLTYMQTESDSIVIDNQL